jgi:anti-sigma regulatory factor (Ser/Thr protein kinase)
MDASPRILPIEDAAGVALARQVVRALGAELGLPEDTLEAGAIVVSELGHNLLRHARLGEVQLAPVHRGGPVGISIMALDRGRGLRDPVTAFRGAPRPESPGLGIGLAGVRRLAAEVDVETRAEEGLRVTARVLRPGSPRQPEVAVVGRPHPDEILSGDDALVVRASDHLLVALADGLGHGPEARRASAAGCRCARDHADRSPVAILQACDRHLRGTRGTAMAVARLDLATDDLTVAVAGNVRVGVYGPEGGRRLGFAPNILGARGGRRLREEVLPRRGRALVLFTDGLPDRTDPSVDRPGVTGWPLPLAARLVARHARDSDDATVLALR